MRKFLSMLLILVTSSVMAQTTLPEAGLNIITYWPTGFTVNPQTVQGQRVQRILQKAKSLGIKTIILNFRGVMYTGTTNEVSSVVPQDQWSQEENEVRSLAEYARSIGLRVAFRPILLVVGPNYEFPYVVDGFYWWHGVINPTDPTAWFESYFKFHQRYMKLAKDCDAVWYSVGAEMHSMTSGLGSRDPSRHFGYPELWLKMIEKSRPLLGKALITYGANYTDQYVLENGQRTWGGELEQWRYYLTAHMLTQQEESHQKSLRELWKALDFMGVDFYRSLGESDTLYPTEFKPLADLLEISTNIHGQDLFSLQRQVWNATGVTKDLYIQEIGYRSVEKSFVKPYIYEGDNTPINFMHQAAAWEAVLRTFWRPHAPLIQGIGIWQVLVDEDTDLQPNGGFSPLGKPLSEEVLRRHF